MGWGLILWAMICLSLPVLEYQIVLQASNWPDTIAGVVSARTEPSKALESAVAKNFLHETVIDYRYRVGKEEYKGEQRSLPHVKSLDKFPGDIQESYKVGSTLKVRYNPGDRKQSILTTAAESFTMIDCVEGGIIFIFGIIFLLILAVARSTM